MTGMSVVNNNSHNHGFGLSGEELAEEARQQAVIDDAIKASRPANWLEEARKAYRETKS